MKKPKANPKEHFSVPIGSVFVAREDYPKPPAGHWPPAPDNKRFIELKRGVNKHGLLTPVFVEHQGGGRFRCISGHYRFQACRELGVKRINVVEVPPEMAEADVGAWYFGEAM